MIVAASAFVKSLSCGIMEAATGVYIFCRRRLAVVAGTNNTRKTELRLYLLSVKVFLGALITLFVQVCVISAKAGFMTR